MNTLPLQRPTASPDPITVQHGSDNTSSGSTPDDTQSTLICWIIVAVLLVGFSLYLLIKCGVLPERSYIDDSSDDEYDHFIRQQSRLIAANDKSRTKAKGSEREILCR